MDDRFKPLAQMGFVRVSGRAVYPNGQMAPQIAYIMLDARRAFSWATYHTGTSVLIDLTTDGGMVKTVLAEGTTFEAVTEAIQDARLAALAAEALGAVSESAVQQLVKGLAAIARPTEQDLRGLIEGPVKEFLTKPGVMEGFQTLAMRTGVKEAVREELEDRTAAAKAAAEKSEAAAARRVKAG